MLWANEVPGGFVHTGIVDSQPQNTRTEKHRKEQELFVLSGRRHVFGFININDCEITQLDAMDALDPDDPAKLRIGRKVYSNLRRVRRRKAGRPRHFHLAHFYLFTKKDYLFKERKAGKS